MKCSSCGKRLTASQKYCPECGAKVENDIEVENKEDLNQANTEVVENKSEPDNTSNMPIDPKFIYAQPKTKPSKMPIAGFVLSIIGLCTQSMICAILGIVFSSISLKDSNGKKNGYAVAGLIISIIALVIIALCVILNIISFTLTDEGFNNYFYDVI